MSFFVFTNQIEKCECCVWFQWFTQWCCSCFSYVVSCWREKKKEELFVSECHLCISFFCLYHSDEVQWVICSISVHRSVTLLLCFQCHCLLILCGQISDIIYVFCVFFLIHLQDEVQWVLCLISMIHLMTLYLCLSSWYLMVRCNKKRVNCLCMPFMYLILFVFTS